MSEPKPDSKPEVKEEEQGEFKVVDRRLFTQDGERRPDAVVEPPKSPSPSQEAARKAPPPPPPPPSKPPASEPLQRQGQAQPQAKPSPAQPSPAAPPSDAQPGDKAAAHFEQLVMSLMTTAMFQLGLAARPGEQPPPADFPAAQETIDLLTALQEKTKGNLSMAETDMLTGGIYELRMAFVELTRRMGYMVGNQAGNQAGNQERISREVIPQPVKKYVWQRDGGKCVKCGSQKKLEFDHIIPLAKGGGNTERNIQLLCEGCNRKKGMSV